MAPRPGPPQKSHTQNERRTAATSVRCMAASGNYYGQPGQCSSRSGRGRARGGQKATERVRPTTRRQRAGGGLVAGT
eukprot:6879461-Prymnesium_polylepis.1